MLWIMLTIGAATLWAVSNIIEKHIMDHDTHDSILATVVTGITTGILFPLIALFNGSIDMNMGTIALAFVLGLVSYLGVWTYFIAIGHEEVSRCIPLFGMIPIFVIVFAYLFLGEQFSALTYLGMFIIIAGSFILSSRSLSIDFSKAFFLILFTSILFAMRNTGIKFATYTESSWAVLFWLGLGGLTFSLAMLFFYHPHIKKKMKVGIKHLVISASLGSIAFILFTKALSLGTASQVSSLIEVQPMLVFIFATVIALKYPKIIKEKITKQILIQKGVAIGMIIIGTILII